MNDKFRILIVDDDNSHAEMVMEFLRITGFSQMDWAENTRDFWKHIDQNDYDIVLLDYMLPDGTGLDMLEQMRSQGDHTPVVMVTGQGDERVAVKAIQYGAADYLLKSGDYLITLPSLIHKTINAHKLQRSVEESLEKIRYQATLLDNVRDAIVVWDLDGLITYWNPAATELFGWLPGERLGRPVAQVYLTAFTPTIKQPRGKDLKKDYESEEHIVRQGENRNGQTIWVSSHVTALSDPEADGRLIGYMDICHDITPRIQAEYALQESEARYRAIVEDYQTELIWRYKPDGSLTFVNEVACSYFKKNRENLLQMNIMELIPRSEYNKMHEHMSSFDSKNAVLTIEHKVIIPGPGINWLQRTDRAIFNEEGQITEFQTVGHDITHQKEMEKEIQAAQARLIQAARMATIGEMASGVAHQIYNPLTTIIADAQILLRKLPTKQHGRDSAEAIEQAGWRLQQVVQRLMDFSRPETDTLTSLAVNETIRQALSLVGAQIEAVGCRLKIRLSDDLPSVRGNPRQLEDLWVNLLLLARDASSDGNGHTIRMQSLLGPKDTIIVEIMDDGEPIPTDKLDTIFEPDFIGTTSSRGSGLELSICREIVRQHRGEISAESAPGSDTIFRIVLPAETPSNEE
jgi:PAS domain S-box-containing protein